VDVMQRPGGRTPQHLQCPGGSGHRGGHAA
jgi:hypothetical protein